MSGLNKEHPNAFYVRKQDEEGTVLNLWGPYATIGAARGQRTNRENENAFNVGDAGVTFTVIESPSWEWKEV